MKIGANEYSFQKLSAMDQFTVARKLAPAIGVMEGLVADRNEGKDIRILVLLMFAKINDADVQFIVDKCLSVAIRHQETGPAKMMVNGTLMFNDITLDDLLQISANVISESLGDFFRSSLAALEAGAARV